MEMEMKAMEDIAMGEDLTSPLSPIASALHDSFLHSHCSSCFSLLPNPNPNSHNSLHNFCSPKCFNFNSSSSSFSSLNFPFSDTADLRASFQILNLILSNPSSFNSGPPERILGLLTNREKLLSSSRTDSIEENEDEDEISMRIRKGAEALALAIRRMRSSCYENVLELEEAVFCLVLTNAVEVQDSEGRTIGIAVYDPRFCLINHSCSPNACYRFSLTPMTETMSDSGETMRRIRPSFSYQGTCQIKSSVRWNLSDFIIKDLQDYSPRIMVRSIKRIRKGEAVTIAYCDLLQSKAMRQSELWSRYRFICCCQRCIVKPLTYVDHALQEISAVKEKLFDSTTISNFNHNDTVRRINDYVDDAIDEYLSIGSPEACCEKLENILTFGFCDEQVEDEGGNRLNLRLHPLHHLSLNAYTTLASAYKVRSSDLSALYSKTDESLCVSFSMSRTSAAYSLLLAGATHHLFLSDPSLIVSAANCWVAAGESLLNLGRTSLWTNNSNRSSPVSNLYNVEKRMCSNCSWIDKFNTSRTHCQALNADIQEFSIGIFNCIADISLQTWSFLTHGCHYLKDFKDPFDFSWPKIRTDLDNQDVGAHSTVSGTYRETKDIFTACEPQVYSDQARRIFQLGIHCLFYGGYLANICYGHHSHLASQIQNILDEMN